MISGRIIATLFVTASLASMIGCSFESEDSSGVSRRDCERLRDHVIDVRLQTITADRDQHRIALKTSLDESFLASCVESTTAEHVKCALAAKNGDELAACSEPTEPVAPLEPALAPDPTTR